MDFFNPFMDPIRSLPSEELVSLRERIELRLKRAFRYGIGHWVLGILFLAVAVGCVRSAWVLKKAHDGDVLSRVEALLATRHSPNSAGVYTGLMSAVLTPINRSDPDQDLAKGLKCKDTNPECRAALVVRENFTQLAQLALSEPKDHPSNVAERIEALLKFEERVDSSQWAAIRSQTTAAVERVWKNMEAPFQAENCKDQKQLKGRVSEWGPQGCLPGGEAAQTHLIVPAREFEDKSSRTISDPRLRRAAWLSELVAPAVASAVTPVVRSDPRDEFRLVQAFFISADGLLRIWTADPFKKGLEESSQDWASATYFAKFITSQPERLEHETSAYIDMGGYGVVATVCSAIDAPNHEELIGIFCTDTKLPENTVAKSIADSPFFEVFRLDLPEREPPVTALDVRVDPVDTSRRIGSIPVQLDRDALRNEVLRKGNENRLSASGVQALEWTSQASGYQRVFLIPMKSRGDLLTRGLIVVPTTPTLIWSVPMLVVAGVALVLGASLIAASLTRARRAHDYAHRLSVLRNLPVGVVEVNSDEDILLGNDRAEEILGRQLPKSQPSAIEINFRADVIQDFVVPEIDGELGRRLEKYEEEVAERRKSDEYSSYYACLRGTGGKRWIRITAVPVLTEGLDLSARVRGAKPPATFGVLEQPSSEELAELYELARIQLFKADPREGAADV